MNNDPDRVIRLATDLRFADSSRPYDKVGLYLDSVMYGMKADNVAEMDELLPIQ